MSLRRYFLCAALLLSPTPALAQQLGGDCSSQNPQACLDGVSSTVTGYDSLRVASQPPARRHEEEEEEQEQPAAGARLDASARGLLRSLLGEPGAAGYASWIGYTRSDFESEVPVAPYEADLDSVLIGFERLLADGSSVGLALSLEARDSDTRYNGGGEESEGVGVLLYAVHPFGEELSLDGALGYMALDTDQDRIDPTSVPGLPTRLRASFDSDRWFASTNLVNLHELGAAWLLTLRAGALYAFELADGYTETGGPSARSVRSKRLHLLQASAGGDLAWRFDGGTEVYGFAGYRRDLDRDDGNSAGGLPGSVGNTQPDDRDETEAGLGLRFFGRRGFSASAEWLRTLAREDFESDSWSVLLRSEF